MKKIIITIIVAVFAIGLYGCDQTENETTTINDEISSIHSVNDAINSDIKEVVLLYRDSQTTYDDLISSSEKLSQLREDIDSLQVRIDNMNSKEDNLLSYNTKMFVVYDEIMDGLEQWREEKIDDYSDSSDLSRTYRTTSDSNRAIIINKKIQLIDLYKPDYSIIE